MVPWSSGMGPWLTTR